MEYYQKKFDNKDYSITFALPKKLGMNIKI